MLQAPPSPCWPGPGAPADSRARPRRTGASCWAAGAGGRTPAEEGRWSAGSGVSGVGGQRGRGGPQAARTWAGWGLGAWAPGPPRPGAQGSDPSPHQSRGARKKEGASRGPPHPLPGPPIPAPRPPHRLGPFRGPRDLDAESGSPDRTARLAPFTPEVWGHAGPPEAAPIARPSPPRPSARQRTPAAGARDPAGPAPPPGSHWLQPQSVSPAPRCRPGNKARLRLGAGAPRKGPGGMCQPRADAKRGRRLPQTRDGRGPRSRAWTRGSYNSGFRGGRRGLRPAVCRREHFRRNEQANHNDIHKDGFKGFVLKTS